MSTDRDRRLDQLLVEQGLAETRTRAQALIMAGLVFSGDRRLDKPGMLVAGDAPLAIKGRDHAWVSRGGVKLAHALDRFGIDPTGLVCLDVGASTGGFTDVLLSRGAARVYAVDVGRGQLAWKLRVDPRVIVLERVNARDLTPALIPERIDLVACDVSFISLTLALPPALTLTAPCARLVALVKPQFEVGRGQVGKGGIVRDSGARREVCERISAWLAAQPGWEVSGLVESPITGADGNLEYLLAGVRRPQLEPVTRGAPVPGETGLQRNPAKLNVVNASFPRSGDRPSRSTAVSTSSIRESGRPASLVGESMQVSEVMVSDVEAAESNVPLSEVARRMREFGIGFMPIVEGERLVGVITDRDIAVRSVSESQDPEKVVAHDVMSLEVVCCFQDESVEHARQLMTEHNLRRLPVIDRDHHLVGIVKLPDLQGQSTPIKKAVKVTFHKEKTDAYGHPHRVPIKTVYITGAKDKEAAQAAAIKHLEEEKGGRWEQVVDGVEAEEEPDGKKKTE